MISIKQVAYCIGLSGSIDIIRQFYGYAFFGHKGTLSLLEQVHLLQGKYVDLNLIRVGIENFTVNHEKIIDHAIQRMREIYAQVNLGVGRIERWYITEAMAETLNIFLSIGPPDDEVDELPDEFTVPNDAIDVFLVLAWDYEPGGTLGRSSTNGPCDKDNPFEMTGCVVSMEDAMKANGMPNLSLYTYTAKHIAHEVGHYLGLPHVEEDLLTILELNASLTNDSEVLYKMVHNLMASGDFITEYNDNSTAEFDVITTEAFLLTPGQGARMKDHCLVQDGCS